MLDTNDVLDEAKRGSDWLGFAVAIERGVWYIERSIIWPEQFEHGRIERMKLAMTAPLPCVLRRIRTM